jgi:hypothetical protein
MTAPPADARYLLAVIDPDNTVAESDEPAGQMGANNVKSLQLQPDIVAVQVGVNSSGAFVYFNVSGAPLPAPSKVSLYWSKDDAWDGADVPAASPISLPAGTSPGTYSEGVLTENLLPAPPGTAYLLAVLDPDNTVTESNESNNVAAAAVFIRPTVEVLPPADPVMGVDYSLRVRVTNNASVPITMKVEWKEIYVDEALVKLKEPPASDPPPQTVILLPGEAQVLTLGTFNHRWDWLPANPPTISEEVKDRVISAVESNLPELLLELLKTLKGNASLYRRTKAITDWAAVLGTQIDMASLNLEARPSVRVNYFIKASLGDGEVVFSQTVPVVIRVPSEQQNHYIKHLLYFTLAERFRTNIPPLDLVLPDIFRLLAKREYDLALNGG